MMFWIALIIVSLLILQDLLLVCFFISGYKDYHQKLPDTALPKISVLIPARNEADALPACLEALEAMDYPTDKLEIIMADDQSEDDTAAILTKWTAQHPNRILVPIRPRYPHLNGKANALAQMVHRTSGDLLLFTDADCRVNPQWAREMVGAFKPAYGLVVGVTRVKSRKFINRLQGQDWWLTLGMIKVTADLGNLLSAVGNNMLISKSAYDKVGGYESLPFSVTEDFAMGKVLKETGYQPIFHFAEKSLVDTKAEQGFGSLMKQRKRWMKGALSLEWYWQFLLALQALYFPFVISILIFDLPMGLGLWMVKVCLQVFFARLLVKKTSISVPFWELFIFEVYYLVISWSTIVYYFWPSKINWKERKY